MNEELPSRRVEITFIVRPPARQVARASGVSEVEVDGTRVRCVVCLTGVMPQYEGLLAFPTGVALIDLGYSVWHAQRAVEVRSITSHVISSDYVLGTW
jgi:hypothetical protein